MIFLKLQLSLLHHRHKLKVHSTDKRYECRYCGIRKTAPSMVRQHELIHQEPKFKCREEIQWGKFGQSFDSKYIVWLF